MNFWSIVFLAILFWWLLYKGQKRQRQKIFKIVNSRNGQVVAEKISRANVAVHRLVGLLNTPFLHAGEALVISPAKAIHMQNLAYPLDLVFLDRHLKIVKCFESLPPSLNKKIYFGGWRSKTAIEFPAGTIQKMDLKVSDQIEFALVES